MIQLPWPVKFDCIKASAACKTQVHLFLIMIAGQRARVDKYSIETPLEFISIGRIVQGVVIFWFLHAKSRK